MRRRCPAVLKTQLLLQQNNTCFYCQLPFGEMVWYKNKTIILSINYDHIVPYAYLQTNPDNNWAAACQICNRLKGSAMFDSISEVFQYVQGKRFKQNVSRMQQAIQIKPTKEVVLQPKVPVAKLESKASKNKRRPNYQIEMNDDFEDWGDLKNLIDDTDDMGPES